MLLRFVLFVCGAVVMSLEILATRILAPEFGDTLQVWGALIGAFIGALSIGYWLGGMLADSWPTRKGVACLMLVSGVFVAGLVPYTGTINERIYVLDVADAAGIWAKPLLSAVLLYGLPVMLLGAVNPYCVRLSADDLHKLGRKVGGLYAISSLGSICGTFLTAFYLVGEFPVRATIRAQGVLLLALSLPILVAGFRERSSNQ